MIWNPDLHPRDKLGRFAAKLGQLGPGEVLRLEGSGVMVRKQTGAVVVRTPSGALEHHSSATSAISRALELHNKERAGIETDEGAVADIERQIAEDRRRLISEQRAIAARPSSRPSKEKKPESSHEVLLREIRNERRRTLITIRDSRGNIKHSYRPKDKRSDQ